MKNGLIA